MGNPSLDDLLAEIEKEAASELSVESAGGDELAKPVSAGMGEVAVHEEVPAPASPSPLKFDSQGSAIPQITRQYLGGGTVVSDNMQIPGLTPRQQALPKLSFRMLGSIAAMLVLVVGLGSAVVLTQRPQDIRQYASDQSNQQLDPELQQYMSDDSAAPTTMDQADQDIGSAPAEGNALAMMNQAVSQPWWQNPVVIAAAAVVISAFLILAVFLHWLFAA